MTMRPDYGDLPYLLEVKVDKHLFRALVLYWILPIAALLDLVPTVEEYKTLLRCQGSKLTKLILEPQTS
ncbi:hypothetical protein Goshw_005847 [Gossypium schwendimanii]|uniref:Uncharacterized protein n=1 Tax=Gossypium schwendimanii TaxID=34291 RepID=A0A7J9MG90_GOSSC|nr:hypothetical protein [Gossypium schwendimanii]